MVTHFIMRNESKSHPLLAQIPLTVSPFISLPTATTLPYTYKTLPSTLPPSSTGSTTAAATDEKPKYVVSASGHAAHPDDITSSCQALREYLQKRQDEADKALNEWDDGIRARDLAEKRRVAPGWLDSDARLLKPQRKESTVEQNTVPQVQDSLVVHADRRIVNSNNSTAQFSDIPTRNDLNGSAEGEELDRAFGGFSLR